MSSIRLDADGRRSSNDLVIGISYFQLSFIPGIGVLSMPPGCGPERYRLDYWLRVCLHLGLARCGVVGWAVLLVVVLVFGGLGVRSSVPLFSFWCVFVGGVGFAGGRAVLCLVLTRLGLFGLGFII